MSEEQGYMKNVEFLDEFDDVFKEDDIEPYNSHIHRGYTNGTNIYNERQGNNNNSNIAQVILILHVCGFDLSASHFNISMPYFSRIIDLFLSLIISHQLDRYAANQQRAFQSLLKR